MNTQVGGNHYTEMKISPLELSYTIAGGDALFTKLVKYLTRSKGEDKKLDLCKAEDIINKSKVFHTKYTLVLNESNRSELIEFCSQFPEYSTVLYLIISNFMLGDSEESKHYLYKHYMDLFVTPNSKYTSYTLKGKCKDLLKLESPDQTTVYQIDLDIMQELLGYRLKDRLLPLIDNPKDGCVLVEFDELYKVIYDSFKGTLLLGEALNTFNLDTIDDFFDTTRFKVKLDNLSLVECVQLLKKQLEEKLNSSESVPKVIHILKSIAHALSISLVTCLVDHEK